MPCPFTIPLLTKTFQNRNEVSVGGDFKIFLKFSLLNDYNSTKTWGHSVKESGVGVVINYQNTAPIMQGQYFKLIEHQKSHVNIENIKENISSVSLRRLSCR